MKMLIVGLVNNPQLTRLKDEGKKLGHDVVGCYSKDLLILSDKSRFESFAAGVPLSEYGVIYFWTLGDKRWEWYTAGVYLSEKHNTVIVNKSTITNDFNYTPTPTYSYLAQFKNNLPFPKTVVIFDNKQLERILDEFSFPLVLKEANLHKGKGVYKANSLEEAQKTITRLSGPIVVREYIENDGDIRVFTVGFKAIGAMKRIPKKGEFRSNISLGGSGEEYDLDNNPQITKIAEDASEAVGIEIAGVDIILDKNTGEPLILEVNDGPQFSGLEQYTKTNAAYEIIKYLEKLYKAR